MGEKRQYIGVTIKLSPSDELLELLQKFSDITGRLRATVALDILESAKPQIHESIKILERAEKLPELVSPKGIINGMNRRQRRPRVFKNPTLDAQTLQKERQRKPKKMAVSR